MTFIARRPEPCDVEPVTIHRHDKLVVTGHRATAHGVAGEGDTAHEAVDALTVALRGSHAS